MSDTSNSGTVAARQPGLASGQAAASRGAEAFAAAAAQKSDFAGSQGADDSSVAPVHKQYQETMPKLELDINSRVLVTLNPISSTKPVRLQGEFLGASHYEYLILRLPSIPGLIKKLIPQMRVEVSFQCNGAIHRFFAEIIQYTSKPGLLIFISYPDRMRVTKTRKHHRVTCALPVTLTTTYGDAIAAIKDLSRGGCRLVLELTGQSVMRQLSEGDRVVFQVCFSAGGEVVRGIGIVRGLETTGSRMSIGLAFDEGHKAFGEALAAYLDFIQIIY